MPQTSNPNPLQSLIGSTICSIEGIEKGSEEVRIAYRTNQNHIQVLTMFHQQDCCENVFVQSVEGDTNLEGCIVTYAGEIISEQESDNFSTNTKTFYTIACAEKTMVIRWYGESNGYYSERVDIRIKDLGPNS